MSDEKYRSTFAYLRAKASRAALQALIAPLVRWHPLEHPGDGYTVIVASNRDLLPLLAANLELLARQDLTDAREVLVVIAGTRDQVGTKTERSLLDRFPGLPLRMLYYSMAQAAVAQRIDWGWVYSWLSWCLGIAAAQTRWVMLHDLDSLLLRPSLLAERYRAARLGDAQYLGVRYYSGGGITEAS
jgi:hypothetical protein